MQILQDNHPSLRRECLPVEITPEMKVLATTMLGCLMGKGVGLSANQVGYPHRIIVIHNPPTQIVMFNPEVYEVRGALVPFNEGCLSAPKGKIVNVARPTVIGVAWTNEAGEPKRRLFTGITARIIQHELAHLDGRLMSDAVPHCKDIEKLLDIQKK